MCVILLCITRLSAVLVGFGRTSWLGQQSQSTSVKDLGIMRAQCAEGSKSALLRLAFQGFTDQDLSHANRADNSSKPMQSYVPRVAYCFRSFVLSSWYSDGCMAECNARCYRGLCNLPRRRFSFQDACHQEVQAPVL